MHPLQYCYYSNFFVLLLLLLFLIHTHCPVQRKLALAIAVVVVPKVCTCPLSILTNSSEDAKVPACYLGVTDVDVDLMLLFYSTIIVLYCRTFLKCASVIKFISKLDDTIMWKRHTK